MSKNFNIGMHLNVYESVWFKLDAMIDAIVLYLLMLVCAQHFDTCLIDLDFDSRSILEDGMWLPLWLDWEKNSHICKNFIKNVELQIYIAGNVEKEEDSKSQESKEPNFCSSYLTKISVNLDGIWYTFETCWCDEPHTNFISSILYLRERSLLLWFY